MKLNCGVFAGFLLIVIRAFFSEDALDLVKGDGVIRQGFTGEERFDVVAENDDDSGDDSRDAANNDQENHQDEDQGPPLPRLNQFTAVTNSIGAFEFLGDVKIRVNRGGVFLVAIESERFERTVSVDGSTSESIDMESVEICGRGVNSMRDVHFAIRPGICDSGVKHDCAQEFGLVLIARIDERDWMGSGVKIVDSSADGRDIGESREGVSPRSSEIEKRYRFGAITGLVADTKTFLDGVEPDVADVIDFGIGRRVL